MHRINPAVLLALGGCLAFGVIGTAGAQSGNWPVPPQNSFQGCAGRGSIDDIGAPNQSFDSPNLD